MVFRRVIRCHHLVAGQVTLAEAARVPDRHRVVLTLLVVQAWRGLLPVAIEIRLVSGLLCTVTTLVLFLVGATFVLNCVQAARLVTVCQIRAKALANWWLIETLGLVALS